jgi:hypothetical protein
MCPKLRCMAWSVGIARVFYCQGYSLRYVEHNPWLGTRGKWMDIQIQGIFCSESCLHGSCTSCSPVKLTKLNLDSSTLLEIWLEHCSVIVPSIHGALHDDSPSKSLIQQLIFKSCRQCCGTICGENLLHNQELDPYKIHRRCLFIYSRISHFEFRLQFFFCKVSSNCWIKCHNLNMGCWSFLVSGEQYWVNSPKTSYVVFG